ncbi:hypothetical protein Y032_0017g3397 [Ancylostoma ceylanicum]|uniref:Uncharacterized protein n=1 Tax=Ancylostoma ceylanicum TaxID=53326 RepID=A0A016V719_9BILA|nr:hypothetical protein Y032_0017g3397 [Ancylostoma ceylanicum]
MQKVTKIFEVDGLLINQPMVIGVTPVSWCIVEPLDHTRQRGPHFWPQHLRQTCPQSHQECVACLYAITEREKL